MLKFTPYVDPLRTSARWRRSLRNRATARGAMHSGAPPSATSLPDLADDHQADTQQQTGDPVTQVDQFLREALEKPHERLLGTYRPPASIVSRSLISFTRATYWNNDAWLIGAYFFPLKSYLLISGAH